MRSVPDWHSYFLGIAAAVAVRANCTRRRIGAVVVNQDHRVVSTGYNGAPPGRPSCLTDGACPRGLLSNEELLPGSSYDTGPGVCSSIHAELNALLHGDSTAYRFGTCYVTSVPCDGCIRAMRGAGLAHIVYLDEAGRTVELNLYLDRNELFVVRPGNELACTRCGRRLVAGETYRDRPIECIPCAELVSVKGPVEIPGATARH